jgi:hypothetical protein
MKQLYGAYGANTNIDSMQQRCPDSTPYYGWEQPSDLPMRVLQTAVPTALFDLLFDRIEAVQ